MNNIKFSLNKAPKNCLFLTDQPYFWKSGIKFLLYKRIPVLIFKIPEFIYFSWNQKFHILNENKTDFSITFWDIFVWNTLWNDKILKLSKVNPYLSFFLKSDKVLLIIYISEAKKKKVCLTYPRA